MELLSDPLNYKGIHCDPHCPLELPKYLNYQPTKVPLRTYYSRSVLSCTHYYCLNQESGFIIVPYLLNSSVIIVFIHINNGIIVVPVYIYSQL